MKKQWKRLAALSSAAVMAAGTLLYFPTDTLQNISWGITASAEETGAVTWTKIEDDGLTWTLYDNGTLTISGKGAMKNYDANNSPVAQKTDSVKKVVIQEGVTSIGDYAFFDCSNLTDITIPESVTNIEDSAFEYCSSLTGITIPESVTSIERYAFRNCTGLKSITIPKSVESVGDEAFSGCTALTEVLLEGGSTLTSESFGEVANKVVTRWNEDNLTWTLTADGTMTISGTGAMRDYYHDSPAAQKKDSVKKVVIEDGVTSIGTFAFSDCTGLTSIEIPEGVTSIGGSAFSGTPDLQRRVTG